MMGSFLGISSSEGSLGRVVKPSRWWGEILKVAEDRNVGLFFNSLGENYRGWEVHSILGGLLSQV